MSSLIIPFIHHRQLEKVTVYFGKLSRTVGKWKEGFNPIAQARRLDRRS